MLQFSESEISNGRVCIWIPSLGQPGSMWQNLAAELSNCDHIFVDLPGHAQAAPAAKPFSIVDLAHELKPLVEKVQLQGSEVVVIGLSIGGAIALELSAITTEKTIFAVMGCGVTIGNPETWNERAQLAETKGTAVMAEAAKSRWFTKEFAELKPIEVENCLENLRKVDGLSYGLCARALAGYDFTERAHVSRGRVLVLSGEHDAVSPVSKGEELAKMLPNSEFFEVRGVSHLFPIEKPIEVVQLLKNFLVKAAS